MASCSCSCECIFVSVLCICKIIIAEVDHSYFEPLQIGSSKVIAVEAPEIDSNPGLKTIKEIIGPEQGGPEAITYLLSLGAGKMHQRPFPRSSFWSLRNNAATPHLRSHAENIHQHMKSIASRKKFKYQRFEFSHTLSNTIGWDGRKLPSKSKPHPKMYDIIHDIVKTHLVQQKVRDELQEAALYLVKIRQKRAKTPRWKEFSQGVDPRSGQT